MLISQEKKIIFVHIQKTGGSSIIRALEQHVPDIAPILKIHDSAEQGKNHLGEELWEQYFKFAIVRNPWDRLVSWYSMIMQRGTLFTSLQRLFKRHNNQLWQYVLQNSNSFEEFITNCTETIVDDGQEKSFSRNQYDYLADKNGNLIVDFVGKFEQLDQDTQTIFNSIGIPNIALPHENKSKHKHYREYYNEHLVEIISKRFQKDIEYFDYKF